MFADCYLGDFLWGTAMQTERKQSVRRRQENRDQVLEVLIDRGICDKTFPDIPDVGVDRAMHHLSSMVQWLLTR